MINVDKVMYPLSDAQNLLRWSEIFSIERNKVKENNILSFYVKIPEDKSISCEKIAQALEDTFNELVRNNDSLRIRIIKTLKGFRQYISDFEPVRLERVNVDGDAGFQDFVNHMGQYKVDWTDEHLIIGKIAIMSEHQCGLILRIHHAIFDGYSIELYFKQFVQAYDFFIKGETPPEPARTFSICEYFKDIANYTSSEQHKRDWKFWFHTYNHQRKYSFPAGHRALKGDCSEESTLIDGSLYQGAVQLSDKMNCSLPSFMMSMAALTTYVMTKKENFCIYSLSHGRRTFVLRKTIGCMMNTVPIFYDIEDANRPVLDFVAENYRNYMETFTHARFKMGEQVPLSYKEPILHGFNFNHGWLLFSWMNYEAVYENSQIEIGDLPQLDQECQLYASVLEVPGKHILLGMQYQTHKFSAQQVNNMLQTYKDVLEYVIQNQDASVAELCKALRK